jgi:hypothetical protein
LGTDRLLSTAVLVVDESWSDGWEKVIGQTSLRASRYPQTERKFSRFPSFEPNLYSNMTVALEATLQNRLEETNNKKDEQLVRICRFS